jgi:predicted Zn-dependent peptidase
MIINKKSQTNLSGFYIVYEGSTNLEKPGWYGISHLMEHLVCKAFDHLQEDLDRDGIEWNAYTSSNEIVFYLTGLDERVNKWKYRLVELLSEFKVTEEEFENERKIVLEEYMDCFNDQTQAHSLNLSRKLFKDYDPIGLRSDLEKIKFSDCLEYFELQYSKPTKILNISKNYEYKNDTIEFSKNEIKNENHYGDNEVELELNNEFKDKTSIIILSPIITEDFAYVSFINSMLGLGLKSPLYQEVREKRGLAYYVQCYQTRMYDKGLTVIATQVSNNNVDAAIKAIKGVIENSNTYLTQERFDIVKDYFTVRKEKNEILSYERAISTITQPEGWSMYDILETVTLDKIKEVYEKYYDFTKFYISNDKEEFLKASN